ncbi:hypothetical protein L798_04297 [Zootermopsis nevadensis]|uniref:Uncharacterized protein n=1 Tax=Zootermopsis nevadensis TaxID=136037 RepID=A0A067RX85_ZOONE|nr:hypothetical protein L798_04297 [Zootermopsis nevadensis]
MELGLSSTRITNGFICRIRKYAVKLIKSRVNTGLLMHTGPSHKRIQFLKHSLHWLRELSCLLP